MKTHASTRTRWRTTPKFDGSRNERKNVAILFAHLKTTLRFEQITRPERNQ